MTRNVSRNVALAALLGALFLPLGSVPAVAAPPGPAHLIRDINLRPDDDIGSAPVRFHALGHRAFFIGLTPETGFELFVTDGTPAGTHLVRDINPGPADGFTRHGSSTTDFVELGGELYFPADDGVHGYELWKTDGTEQGTVMVEDVRPGSASSVVRLNGSSPVLSLRHAAAGGLLYLVLDDGVHGFELWRTDGTAAGTILLLDMLPGSASSFGSSASATLDTAVCGGGLVFAGQDTDHGRELWASDGTPAGTGMLADLRPGPASSYPGQFRAFDGRCVFAADDGVHGTEPWISDGTGLGTAMILDVDPVSDLSSEPKWLGELDGILLFEAYTPALGRELWATDGTAAATTLVMDIRPGAASPLLNPLGVTAEALYFMANDGVHGQEPWRTDGTPAGTRLVKDILPGPGSGIPVRAPLGTVGPLLLFRADDGAHGQEPWSTDGTEAGTRLVGDLAPGAGSSSASPMVQLDDAVLFSAIPDGLWRSDGTAQGTLGLGIGSSTDRSAAVVDGLVFFAGDDGVHGAEPWRTDGTAAGTFLVRDVNPSIHTLGSVSFVLPRQAVSALPRIFIGADDGVRGSELWLSDGTAAGTTLVDILPGAGGSSPSAPIEFHGTLLFAARGVDGPRLWRSDGTPGGTAPVSDQDVTGVQWLGELDGALYFANASLLWKTDGTAGGTGPVAPIYVGKPGGAVLGDYLYFSGGDATTGEELWRTDGTAAGTTLVADIGPGSDSSEPEDLTVLGGALLFRAYDRDHGRELWRSDGTREGTLLVKDVYPGFNNGIIFDSGLLEAGDAVYFSGSDGVHGYELWKSDGTEQGTVMVRDLRPGSFSSSPRLLAAMQRTLFFAASDGQTGISLWKSDGTSVGTTLVSEDVNPYTFSRPDGYVIDAAGALVFSGRTNEEGWEPWCSDGTNAGTFLADDLWPGETGSYPQHLAFGGDRVVFVADDGTTGSEPWIAHAAILLRQPRRGVSDLREEVLALQLDPRVETSLTTPLEDVSRALTRERYAQASSALRTFAQAVDGQTPQWIDAASSAALIGFAEELTQLIEGTEPVPRGDLRRAGAGIATDVSIARANHASRLGGSP